MEACALREVWAAARELAALPTTPAAAVGTVAHRLLEEAGRGNFSCVPESAIERRWDELLRRAEAACAESWLNRHLVPLATAVPDFEVRRLQALAAAGALAEAAATARSEEPDQPRGLPSGCEVPVSTPDGRAGGRIDLVSQTAGGPALKDYKSGAIHARGAATRDLKPEYAIQLKLYAAIYAAMTGTWPERLEVVPIAGPPEEVPFTQEECHHLLLRALQRRDEINAVVGEDAPLQDRTHRLANPDPSVCGYCPYRPHCPPYRAVLREQREAAWPMDVWGQLTDIRLLGNGRRLLTINTSKDTTYVRGIDPSPGRHPALDTASPGVAIGCYNLRPGGSPTSFTEGPYTTFYREARAPAFPGATRA
jgi:RecB family exonuclease